MAEELTYDPVVEGQSWQRVRPLGPLPPPPPGRALVLVPERGPAVTVRPGESVPDARLGVYRSTVLVDTAEHRLLLPLQLPCAERGFTFRCRVTVLCAVADPAGVVARGIRDIGSTVYGPVRELLGTAAGSYRAAQAREAEAALNSALHGFTCGPLVRLREAHVELRAEAVPPPRAVRTLQGEVLSRHDTSPGAPGPAEAPPGAPPGAAPNFGLVHGGSSPDAGGGSAPGIPRTRSSRVRGTGDPAPRGTGRASRASRVRGSGAGGGQSAQTGQTGQSGAGGAAAPGGSRVTGLRDRRVGGASLDAVPVENPGNGPVDGTRDDMGNATADPVDGGGAGNRTAGGPADSRTRTRRPGTGDGGTA